MFRYQWNLWGGGGGCLPSRGRVRPIPGEALLAQSAEMEGGQQGKGAAEQQHREVLFPVICPARAGPARNCFGKGGGGKRREKI